MIRQSLKFSSILGFLAGMALESIVIGLTEREDPKRKKKREALISRYSRRGLKVLGLDVVIDGQCEPSPALRVGNHQSYLDVLVLAASCPTLFVTSEEIHEVPILGQLCELGGCLFVERRSRARLTAEVTQLSQALRESRNVTVFPEATSTNGESVLRFRRPLFLSAIQAKVDVQPFSIVYEVMNGEAMSRANRDLVCWYDDMAFLPHLWKLCGCKGGRVRLKWLPPISMNEQLTEADLAATSHQMVTTNFVPFPSLQMA